MGVFQIERAYFFQTNQGKRQNAQMTSSVRKVYQSRPKTNYSIIQSSVMLNLSKFASKPHQHIDIHTYALSIRIPTLNLHLQNYQYIFYFYFSKNFIVYHY